FHNNRLGIYNQDPSVGGRVAAYEEAMSELLNPLTRNIIASVQRPTDWIVIPTPLGNINLPAGPPVAAFANTDPATGRNLCPDFPENQGHYYGAWLSPSDKLALTEYLKTR